MSGTTQLENNLAQVVVGAKACLERSLPIPALILIYTLADSFAWAVSPDEKNTRTRFETWVAKYVYPYHQLPCTPTELYAARCAVLHTLTSKSDLHVSGGYREVAYAWGNAELNTISQVTTLGGMSSKSVGLHVNELLEAIAAGIHRTFEAANSDPGLAATLERTASLHYVHPPRSFVEAAAKVLGAGE